MNKHCDEYIRDKTQPSCLRVFLLYHRVPAVARRRWQLRGWPVPDLYAEFKGRRVRLTMASRFGDVGITENLRAPSYRKRVMIGQLTNFSPKRTPI